MLFRKKEIKETKRYPYRGRVSRETSISSWDGMSMIEKFAMIFLPVMQCFIF